MPAELLRQFGDGGGARKDSVRGDLVAAVVTRRRLARGRGGDAVMHWIWLVESVLPGGASEGEVLEHGKKVSRSEAVVYMYGANWPGRQKPSQDRNVQEAEC